MIYLVRFFLKQKIDLNINVWLLFSHVHVITKLYACYFDTKREILKKCNAGIFHTITVHRD